MGIDEVVVGFVVVVVVDVVVVEVVVVRVWGDTPPGVDDGLRVVAETQR